MEFDAVSQRDGSRPIRRATYQRFDSLAVEEGGNICVAALVRGGISVFSPQGELVEFYEAPEGYCTNICFGGADWRTAYITLSGYGQLLEYAGRGPVCDWRDKAGGSLCPVTPSRRSNRAVSI